MTPRTEPLPVYVLTCNVPLLNPHNNQNVTYTPPFTYHFGAKIMALPCAKHASGATAKRVELPNGKGTYYPLNVVLRSVTESKIISDSSAAPMSPEAAILG